MLFNTPHVADWIEIWSCWQEKLNKDNKRKNARCILYDYEIGHKVLVCKDGILQKAEAKYKEPYIITQVFWNAF